MVLAERHEGNRPLDDLVDLAGRAALALGGKRGKQLRVALVPIGRVEQRTDEAPGRVDRAR